MKRVISIALILLLSLCMVSPAHAAQTQPNEKPLYQKETVSSLYSLDYANRRYHKITDAEMIKEILSILNQYTPPKHSSKDQVGFLIFTKKGKYAFYLPRKSNYKTNENLSRLTDLSVQCNKKTAGTAQWLTYMSTSNISHISYSGQAGRGYTNKNNIKNEVSVGIDTTDKNTMRQAGAFLKTLAVNASPHIIAEKNADNPSMVMGLIDLRIEFKTGVTYTIFAYETGFSIASSDMNETIFYECSKETVRSLRDFMWDLQMQSDK